jgi:hypothetical protein
VTPERSLSSALLFVAQDLDNRAYAFAGVIRRAARALAELESRDVPDVGECPQCGGPVERAERGRSKVYCSARCRRRACATKHATKWSARSMDTTMSLLVPLMDLASRLNVPGDFVIGWVQRLKIKTEHNWAGFPAISEPDARKLIAAAEQSGRESAELHSAHEAYLQDWARRQRDAGEEAFTAYVDAALEHQRARALPNGYAFYGGLEHLWQPVGAGTYADANQRAAAARSEFAKRNPKITDIYEFEKRRKRGKV